MTNHFTSYQLEYFLINTSFHFVLLIPFQLIIFIKIENES